MVRMLHIAVSPLNGGSFSARIAAEFVNSWNESNPDGTVDLFNLWSEPLPPFDAVGASWKIKTMGGQDPDAAEQALFVRVKAVVDRFLAADQYLFSVPMWNLHIPYPLKHFIDVIVQLGLTFGFDRAGGTVGLVPSDRPVQLVLTRGGTGYGSGGPLEGADHQEPYLREILHFIGLTDVRSIVAEGTSYGPQVAQPALDRALAEARAAAKEFGRRPATTTETARTPA